MTSVVASNFGPTFSKKVECLNENGNPVDYWVAIKNPKGTDYFYYDSNNRDFHMSPHSLNDTVVGALAHTTKQLWLPDANYVIYNDQPPKNDIDINDIEDLVNAGKGHTKGFFAFSNDNDDSGFWLTHSIPLFPTGPKENADYQGLGSNARTYAQNLLCLSVGASVLNEMSKQFLLNRPQLYESHLTVKAEEKYENIKNLVDGKYSTLKVCESVTFMTQSGMPFKLYAKTAEWNNDLYAACVTPTEQDTLWVESWIRGSADGPSCPFIDYDTLDIKILDFDVYGRIYSWSETQDHSKWAITKNKAIICMGDINRMTTQYSRGGGTACFTDEKLHSILKGATSKTNSCAYVFLYGPDVYVF